MRIVMGEIRVDGRDGPRVGGAEEMAAFVETRSVTVTIPDLLAIAEDQGKIDNLRIIAGQKKDGRIRMYNSPDSDLWKIMEAASYTLAWRADPGLDRRLDELIALYAAAQDQDGYINQMFMLPS
jgi:DUF1680 family protein